MNLSQNPVFARPISSTSAGATLLLAASLIFTGCATVTVEEQSITSAKTGQVPALNQESTVAVGGTMFSQFKYWSRTGYRLDEAVNMSFALGRISAPKGTFLAKATSGGGKPAYCTENRTYIDPLVGPHSIACFLGDGGRLTQVSATPGMVSLTKDLSKPITFSISELVTQNDNAFKYELLYQGIAKKTLRIAYREYLREMARPSFFQEATYDIDELPTIISFRSVSIRILSADNNSLKYEVLSGF